MNVINATAYTVGLAKYGLFCYSVVPLVIPWIFYLGGYFGPPGAVLRDQVRNYMIDAIVNYGLSSYGRGYISRDADGTIVNR